MAEDKSQKTEDPTPQKKRKAKQEGQIPKSAEVAAWLSLLVGTFVAPSALAAAGSVLQEKVLAVRSVAQSRQPEPEVAWHVLRDTTTAVSMAAVPLMVVVGLVAFTAMLAQVGVVFAPKAAAPKFSRLSPAKGIKQILSVRGLWETAKSLLKVVAIAVVAVPSVLGIAHDLIGGQQTELATVIPYTGQQVLAVTRTVAFLGLAIAALDYAFQRRRHRKDLMMTKHEVKQDMKNAEGDPHVKARIRSIQMAASRNRMIASVADANVVIVNPTHYAVALKYEAGKGAPKVVAKGADHIAAKIREEADRHGVPVVRQQTLARSLFSACKVGDEVPRDLFQAVAAVLAFVYRVGSKAALSGVYHMPDQ